MGYQPYHEELDLLLESISQNAPQNPDPSMPVSGISFSANADVDLQLINNILDGLQSREYSDHAEEANLPQDPEETYDEEANFRQDSEQTYVEETSFSQDSKQTYDSTANQMTVEIQPPTNIRCRYKSDGVRKIEKSRSKPMTLQLPDLTIYQTNEIDDMWVALSLITTDQNPSKIEFIHVNKLQYQESGVMLAYDGAVLIPLKPEDITKRMKQLPGISIIKKRLEDYDFKLQPYQPIPMSTSSQNVQTYENQTAKTIVAKAKCFRDTYHLELSRIGCHILTRKDDGWFPTGIICKTNIMTEIQPIPSNKRSFSVNLDDEDEEINKKARLPSNPLPTTRV